MTKVLSSTIGIKHTNLASVKNSFSLFEIIVQQNINLYIVRRSTEVHDKLAKFVRWVSM